MSNMKSLLAVLTTTTAIVALAAPAHAAEARDYAIEAGSLEAALDAFGRQSGEQVLYRVDDVKGKVSSGVTGRQSPEQALRKILAGTGLRVVKGAGGALAIAGNGQGGGQTATEASSGQGLRGAIVDATSGAALKGAFIELVGTGQTTTTDDLGRYRFAGVNGTQRVRISYLGFPAIERDIEFIDGQPVSAIVLANEAVANEILVVGYTSARAQALNQERTAENSSTVISADLLGNFQGTTISEALRRAPGIAFEQNGLTGDGTKVIVRGLSPDYNQVKFNGQALLPPGNSGRSADLGGVLADSVSEVRISKTLLANQDSSGTGGLVEIETKSPLDRPDNFVRLGSEYSKRASGFGDELLLTGTVSKRFGADKNFGLSASVQFRRQSVSNYNYSSFGQLGPYLPLGENGAPLMIRDIDPRRSFPFEDGVDGYYIVSTTASYRQSKSETTAITLSAAWDWSNHTNLRLDYTRSDRNSDEEGSSVFTDSGSGYALLPVPELNGANRYVLRANLALAQSGLRADSNSTDDKVDTISFRGKSEFGRLSLNYQAGYNEARSHTPRSYNMLLESRSGLTADAVSPEAIDPSTGRVTSLFGRRAGRGFPLPLFTAAGLAQTEASANTNFSNASVSFDDRSRSRSYNGEFQAKWEIGEVLKYIDVGASYKNSRFQTLGGNREYYSGNYVQDGNGVWVPPSAGRLGLNFREAPFGRVSAGGPSVQFLDPASIPDLIGRRDELTTAGFVSWFAEAPDALQNQTKTEETDFAAYAQARVDIGKLEIIGGVRMSRVKVDSTFTNGIQYFDEFGEFDQAYYDATLGLVSGSATQTDFLPRILANYRISNNMVLRAGYYVSVARPQIQLLTSSQQILLSRQPIGGPSFDQPLLEVNIGNPALKPAYTQSFDFSAEYYSDDVGALKLGIFYKKLDNLLESNIVAGLNNLDGFELPDDPRFQNLPDDLFVTVRKPVNNPDPGHIWGIEASVEKRLTFLPGALAGLGVYANYTYTKSRKNILRSWFTKPVVGPNGSITRVQEDYVIKNVPFAGQPPHSGTVGLTYTGSGFDASIMYTYQARRLGSPGNFGLDIYTEAYDTLDLRASYKFGLLGAEAQLYVEGNNLLRGAGDASVQTSVGGSNGVPRYYTGGDFVGGRAVTGGLTITF